MVTCINVPVCMLPAQIYCKHACNNDTHLRWHRPADFKAKANVNTLQYFTDCYAENTHTHWDGRHQLRQLLQIDLFFQDDRKTLPQ